MEIGKYSTDKLVEYLRKNPDFMTDVMTLHESFDLPKLKEYFSKLDLEAPFSPQLTLHPEYSKYKSEIREIIETPNAYSIDLDTLDQDFLEEDHVIKCFNDCSKDYDNIMATYWPSGRPEIIKTLDPNPGEKILEIGVGTGLNLQYYPEHCQITGVDLAENLLSIAESKVKEHSWSHINLFNMDASNMNFPDNSFDKVLSTYVLCDAKNPLKVLKEINRVCKPNGKIVILDPVKSEIDEVVVLQYLFWPIGRQIGHLWLKIFPPYTILYNTLLDLRNTLAEVGIRIDFEKKFDPFKILTLFVCTNEK